MKISVIIPACNAAGTIGRAIESVILQSHPVHEIIVVDDGSTDKTAEIVQQISSVRYFFQKNSGPSSARNRGVKECAGDYIAFLDSDDYWKFDHIENIVKPLNNYPKLKWSCSAYVRIAPSGEQTIIGLPPKKANNQAFTDFFNATRKIHFLSVISVILNRSFFLETGGFPEKYSRGEDLSLWLRLALTDPTIGYSPIPTAIYSASPRSLTSRQGDIDLLMQRIVDDYLYLLKFPSHKQKVAWPVIRKWLNGLTVKCIKKGRTENIKMILKVFSGNLCFMRRAGLHIFLALMSVIGKKKNG
jgi:glycosyltransferase involved in cell wall biosynthesis